MPTVLIIGAGPRVGQASAEAFAAAGFQVAVASRKQNTGANYRHYTFDAAEPDKVPALFEKVSADLGIPSVVIYNAYKGGMTPPDSPFELGLEDFQAGLNVNTTTPFIAAREAVKGFEKLGPSQLGPAGGTFIFTGNMLNISAIPGLMAFGMQKNATANMIRHLALAAYNGKPYKFYYADERHADGSYVTTDLSGPGHAELFLGLAKNAKQGPWDHTFVSGKGYVEFPQQESLAWYP
ncbi:NAD(P)-binding protein [Annulohypoxylon maeteangense]|uniref:NAD(P)-binding protein n=1 Tax=Annulohypoxylon maeteangense TaxID=1927788 RepID=UPI002008C7D3|nr:NAD(P)-binding protein [Annulohypoxylon maeteangense]KAI0885903.1 NAD(P)-binding protein [Annulohypoxylon maeteangense]